MFVNLFISRWRHPNAEVRINAVTKLNPCKPSDAEKLWQLALHDPELDVRIAAILCIDDLSKLFELMKLDEEAPIINAASTRIEQLYQSLNVTLDDLEQLDSTAITHLLCSSTNAAIHNHFSFTIKQQEHLAHLAMHSALAATRQQAVKRMHDETLIETVRQYAKEHDKAVYRIIREQQKLKQQQLAQKNAAQIQCDELIRQLGDLVNGQYDRYSTTRFAHLSQQWQVIHDLATNEQQSSFAMLQQQFQAQLEIVKAEELAVAAKKAEQEAQRQQIDKIQKSINMIISDQPHVTQENLQQLHQQLESLAEGCIEPKQAQQCEQLQKLLGCFSKILDQSAAFSSLNEQAETAISIEDCDACIDQATSLKNIFKDWSNQFTPHPQLTALNQLISTLQQKRHGLKEQLKAAAEHEQQQQQKVLSEKELLCVAMEALIDLDIPANEKAQHIRSLQQQWKDLDQQVSVSVKSLWDRFHQASKQAYSPCEQYFREQSRLRAWNLSQREQICQLIETYYESLDWSNPDWSSLEQILKKAKAEWREFSPVDRAPGKPLQERFNALIERADDALNGYRQACASAKQLIVEEASELAAADESDFAAATHRFKELQSKWKLIGSAEHKRERQLWKAFREKGDLLFSRLRAHQQHQRSQEELSARLLCVRLEILLNQPSPESDQYLRMEYQMERLEEALETPSSEAQNIELANLVNEWQVEQYAQQYPDLDERFQQLLDLS